MITPEEIRKKAERRIREVFVDCLNHDPELFPMVIPFRKPGRSDDLSVVIESVGILRQCSKEVVGHGYSIEWVTRRSARFGTNQFPEKIRFETREDFLRFLGRKSDFDRYEEAVRRIAERFPPLLPWLEKEGVERVECLTQQGWVDGMLAVTGFVQKYPRCGLFPREIPVPVDTKFIERNRAVLMKWWDLILPPGSIEPGETHFERRFGLGYPEVMIEFRCLEDDSWQRFGFPARHFALPLSESMRWELNSIVKRVVIVENRVNFLTLPHLANTVSMAGMGGQVQLFRHLSWLHAVDIFYWGDLDAQGFEILAGLRRYFPETKSILMDRLTWEEHRSLQGVGTPSRSRNVAGLTDAEEAIYEQCRESNTRLEQEKIPQDWVSARLEEAFATE